ncbi:MAG: hypothetical protein ABII12_00520 [Planctomycetota bacterium]
MDRFTRSVLVVIAALLGVIAVGLWREGPSMLPTAQAQVPDSGMQRNQLLKETQETNGLLRQILEHLQEKSIAVTMRDGDKEKEKGSGARRGRR